jgi:N-carbamoyl-L-amino-acid hydrolase
MSREGARFTPGCSGSAVWAGHTLLSQAHAVSDSSSARSIKQELERIRYLGSEPADYRVNQLSAHFELHIEQQRILQDAQKKIGIVKSIQGIRWYRIHVHGQRAHAGSTPMDQRADAMVAAANLILFFEKRACGVVAVATTGVVELDRPSSNTVPGEVLLTLDLRHPCEAELDGFETAMRLYVSEFEVEHPKIQINTTRIWRSPAAKMNDFAVSCARRAAERIVGEENVMDTTSLAGHDSALTSTRVPTSMIFVPSKDGISHAPEEFTSEEQWYANCIRNNKSLAALLSLFFFFFFFFFSSNADIWTSGAGVQVLLEAVLEYDLSLRHAI